MLYHHGLTLPDQESKCLSFLPPKDFWLFLRPVSVYSLVSVYPFRVENKVLLVFEKPHIRGLLALNNILLWKPLSAHIYYQSDTSHLLSTSKGQTRVWICHIICLRLVPTTLSWGLVLLSTSISQAREPARSPQTGVSGVEVGRKAAQGKRDCQLKPEVRTMCFPLDSLNSFH